MEEERLTSLASEGSGHLWILSYETHTKEVETQDLFRVGFPIIHRIGVVILTQSTFICCSKKILGPFRSN